jgi:hypothetical protein
VLLPAARARAVEGDLCGRGAVQLGDQTSYHRTAEHEAVAVARTLQTGQAPLLDPVKEVEVRRGQLAGVCPPHMDVGSAGHRVTVRRGAPAKRKRPT